MDNRLRVIESSMTGGASRQSRAVAAVWVGVPDVNGFITVAGIMFGEEWGSLYRQTVGEQ